MTLGITLPTARDQSARARRLIVGASKHGSFFRRLRAVLHSYDAAVDWQIDARDVAAFVRRQEENGRGYLFWPSNPPHRRHGFELVLHRIDVRAELPFENGGVGRTWADHISADTLAGELG